ncbi:MAG: hypothetical protein DRI90_04650, partial [Deltaproteobacteria bacterium]
MAKAWGADPKLGSGTVVVGSDGRLEGRADPAALAVLEQLPEAEQRLLQIVAIALAPIGLGRLRKIALRLRPPLAIELVNAAADALQARGLIDREQLGLFCHPYWRDLAAQQAIDQGCAQAIAHDVQREVRSDRSGYQYAPMLELRDLRIAWLLGEVTEADRIGDALRHGYYSYGRSLSIYASLWDGVEPLALPPIGWLPPAEQAGWAIQIFSDTSLNWQVTPEIRAGAKAMLPHAGQAADWCASILNLDALLRGE